MKKKKPWHSKLHIINRFHFQNNNFGFRLVRVLAFLHVLYMEQQSFNVEKMYTYWDRQRGNKCNARKLALLPYFAAQCYLSTHAARNARERVNGCVAIITPSASWILRRFLLIFTGLNQSGGAINSQLSLQAWITRPTPNYSKLHRLSEWTEYTRYRIFYCILIKNTNLWFFKADG